MKRVLALGAMVAALLLVPAYAAQAHPGRWYWNEGRAAGALLQDGIQWSDGYDTITYARCRGYGLYFTRGGYAYYKHLICYVTSDEDYPYYVRFHVLGANRWLVNFLGYA
jgi:hypothetical protein